MRYREREDRFDWALMAICGILECFQVKRDALQRVLADVQGQLTAIRNKGVERG